MLSMFRLLLLAGCRAVVAFVRALQQLRPRARADREPDADNAYTLVPAGPDADAAAMYSPLPLRGQGAGTGTVCSYKTRDYAGTTGEDGSSRRPRAATLTDGNTRPFAIGRQKAPNNGSAEGSSLRPQGAVQTDSMQHSPVWATPVQETTTDVPSELVI